MTQCISQLDQFPGLTYIQRPEYATRPLPIPREEGLIDKMEAGSIVSFLTVINIRVQQPAPGGQDFRSPTTPCFGMRLFWGLGAVIHLFRNYPTPASASVWVTD